MNCLLQVQISCCKETGADSLEPQMVDISAVQALISFRLTVLSCWCHMYNIVWELIIWLFKDCGKFKGKVVKQTTVIHGC